MYAVIKTGGKQILMQQGKRYRIEKIEAKTGDEVALGNVIMFFDGKDYLADPNKLTKKTIKVKVVKQERDKKIPVIRFKRRKNSLKTMNHKQPFTEIEVLQLGDQPASKPAANAQDKKVDATKGQAPTSSKKTAVKKEEPQAKKTDSTKKSTSSEQAKTATKKPKADPVVAKVSEKKASSSSKVDKKKIDTSKKPSASKSKAKKTEE
jgi:large subunit ribosomal protein L21